jgi:predicted MPP superfamily phosphohydrolase
MFPFLLLLKLGIAIVYFIVMTFVLLMIVRSLERYYKGTGNQRLFRLARMIKRLVLFPIVAPFIFGPILFVYTKWIEPNWIDVHRIVIKDPLFSDGLKDVRIVQITDLHVERIGYREKQLIKKINNLHPDIILMNGDFINSQAGWELVREVLSKLKATQGIYTILGNTDYYFADEAYAIPLLKKLGIKVLRYGNLQFDFGKRGRLWLVGISDKYSELAYYGVENYIDEAFKGVPEHEAKLLLIHDPDHATTQKIAGYKPQLILAGDTHGGQIGIEFIRQFSDYANRSEYMAGMFRVNDIPLYVNRGIGMKTLYIRFLCRPEITVIELKKGTL